MGRETLGTRIIRILETKAQCIESKTGNEIRIRIEVKNPPPPY
tara:strand:- start:6623 stop:6751 length:129 start_codon:yes stop_codon:yes gene_type:complete